MVIDCHMHLWDRHAGKGLRPVRYGRFVNDQGKPWQMCPVGFVDCRSTVELALAHLDWLGIDRGVIVQEWMDGRQDDYLATVARDHHDRFSVFGLLDGNDLDGAPDYADHIANDLHFDGIKVTPAHFERTRLDDERMMKAWERCVELGLRVVIHMLGGDEMVEEATNVATALPKLVFIVAHLGLPPREHWQRQAALGKLPNVFLDASGLTALFSSEGCPFPGAQAAIQEALGIVGPGKIMWGSDYPRCNVDISYKEILELFSKACPFLDDRERAGILGDTAARVYRFGG